ncbi:MAG: hypothetical protein IKS51_00900 [Erysipelotrichaceae bacterium]|nr:hypothetical protein [Erysipelotrichaceae bacterium]
MPWYVACYLIGALAAVVLSTIGHAKKNESLQMIAAVISLISGVLLGIGIFGTDMGAGHYAYYVNGVRVASGVMAFFEAIAIAIILGAFPNLLGMFLGSLPFYFKRSPSGKASVGIKALCIFFLAEGILGFIVAVILAIARKNVSAALPGIVMSLIMFGIGLFIKKKWNI